MPHDAALKVADARVLASNYVVFIIFCKLSLNVFFSKCKFVNKCCQWRWRRCAAARLQHHCPSFSALLSSKTRYVAPQAIETTEMQLMSFCDWSKMNINQKRREKVFLPKGVVRVRPLLSLLFWSVG